MKLGDLARPSRGTFLSEGIKLSQRMYRDVLNDPNILVGFESEFHYEVPKSFMWDTMDDISDAGSDAYFEVLNSLSKNLNVRIIPNPEGYERKSRDEWYLDIETSIDDLHSGDLAPEYTEQFEIAPELVSPPMAVSNALEFMDETMFWIAREPGARTSDDTGLHVGVSYNAGQRPSSFDPIKLLFLLGEEQALASFGRDMNLNAQSHMMNLVQFAQGVDFSTFAGKADQIQALLAQLAKGLSMDKHFSFNLGNLRNQGYVEFRITGGAGYENRYQEIKRQVVTYAVLMKAAFDPRAFRKEYLKKLYLFLRSLQTPREPATAA